MIDIPDYLDDAHALLPRAQFDSCIIGYVEVNQEFVLLYDYSMVIDSLMAVQQMTYDEAVQYLYSNMNTGTVLYRHDTI